MFKIGFWNEMHFPYLQIYETMAEIKWLIHNMVYLFYHAPLIIQKFFKTGCLSLLFF